MTPNDRDDLAGLLPGPVERELPGERHRQLQEFVMSEIHRDLRTTRRASRRPLVRRSVLVTSALTAVAAVAAAVGIAATTRPGDSPVTPAPAPLSGQQILLAAANTALRQPEGTGTYWHVKVVAKDAAQKTKDDFETWADRNGVNWIRFARGVPDPNGDGRNFNASRWGDVGFSLCGVYITFDKLQNLPVTPDALKASVTTILADGGADPKRVAERVLYGLVALVSQLPAPPKVRAAAFQAIAAYPGAVNLGPVDGGQALQIPIWGETDTARLVIDPVAAQIRETDFLVVFNQATHAVDGKSSIITAGWTDTPPP